MKIARKIPGVTKVPMYVTETQYEIYYARPESLGKIDYVGSYWYTADGMRFASSRNAMEYLIRMYEATGKVMPERTEPLPVPARKAAPAAKSKPVAQSRKKKLTSRKAPIVDAAAAEKLLTQDIMAAIRRRAGKGLTGSQVRGN